MTSSNVTSEIVIECIKYMENVHGEHVFLPKKIILDEQGLLEKVFNSDIIT